MSSSPAEAGGTVDLQPRAEIAFLLLDGLRRQRPGGGRDVALCALGLTRDGYPRPLTMRLVAVEEERAWRDVLAGLKAEGIGPDLLLISADGHPALIKAIQATYPDTPLQICVAHRLLALARKVDARWRSLCLSGARKIFAAPDRVTAVGLFREWHTHWLKQGEPAVRTLEGDLASCLSFHRFPPHLWNRIRTVNLVERAFREARRTALPASPAAAGPEESDEPETIVVVPASANGHVTPDLIGDITVLPEEEAADAAEMLDGGTSAMPAETMDAPVEAEVPVDSPVEATAVPAQVAEVLAEPPTGAPALPPEMENVSAPSAAPESLGASVATVIPWPVEAEPATDPAAGPALEPEPAPVPLSVRERDEDTAVWLPSPFAGPADGILVFEPRPIDLASDEEFDERLAAAYHRYTYQMRVAVTLTSAAGLMAGVVLAFIR